MVRSTVVVVTWRGRDLVGAALDALAAQTAPHRVLVIDNASDDGTADVLARHPTRPEVVRTARNLGYAGALDAALGAVHGRVGSEFVAWLNDDVEPEPGWLAALQAALDADPGAAAASARLVTPDGATQSLGVALTADGHGRDALPPDVRAPAAPSPPAGDMSGDMGGEVFGFCGGAALVRVDALRAVGGVPAEFFCYYEDTDTSWRLRLAGHRVLSVPAAVAAHRHGASSGLGSPAFHVWNERNRLLTLARCAPAAVAATQVARFALLTAALPARRALGRAVPDAPNFAVGLRARVLAQLARRAPATLAARRRVGRTAAASGVTRHDVWRAWAGATADGRDPRRR